MSRRVLILVEGQTEERFVKDVLVPLLLPRNIFIIPTLLVTKRVKSGPNFKGGVSNFGKFEKDLRLLLRDSDAVVTTLLDYYGLPADFPGMNTRPTGTAKKRVRHVETEVKRHFNDHPALIPFFALHEFEAWLFADTEVLPRVLTEPGKTARFAQIRAEVNSPEEINEHPMTAPSKRILDVFPSYRKAVHGPNAVGQIGLETIRSECEHLDGWLKQLEALE